MGRRRWVGLGVAALAGVLLVPSGARASSIVAGGAPVDVTVDAVSSGMLVNEALIGTNQPVAGVAGEMRAVGVHWARTDFFFESSYNCATGRWDPGPVDQRVEEDLSMGGDPELILDYSPACMTTNPLHESLDPPNAGSYSPWKALVEEAAYHEMVTHGVRIFEVWNEPDGTFWHGTLADYLALYMASAEAVEAAAARAGLSNVLIGGPALVFPDPSWLEPFLAYVSANHLPLGFVSWHYYGDYPAFGPFATSAGPLPPQLPGPGPYWYNPATRAQTYGAQVAQVRAEIAAFPTLHPLTVIDEWNLDAGYDPRADGPYDAAFAAAVLDSSQAAGLDRMAFFRVADDRAGTLGNWGMLYYDLSPKPVYWTFVFWHALAGHLLPARLFPDQSLADSFGRVGAVASRGAGKIRVMLYDYAPYDPSGGYGSTDPNPYGHAVNLRLVGAGRGLWTYTVRAVDADDAGSMVASGRLGSERPLRVELPGESVMLVTFTKAAALRAAHRQRS